MIAASVIRRKYDKDIDYQVCSSEEARICTECTLPASCCDRQICERYKDEKRKLKECKRNGRR